MCTWGYGFLGCRLRRHLRHGPLASRWHQMTNSVTLNSRWHQMANSVTLASRWHQTERRAPHIQCTGLALHVAVYTAANSWCGPRCVEKRTPSSEKRYWVGTLLNRLNKLSPAPRSPRIQCWLGFRKLCTRTQCADPPAQHWIRGCGGRANSQVNTFFRRVVSDSH